MATLSDYMSGTISLANGSVTVTGTGTLFEVTRFREGDTLQIQNLTAVIASVDSNTQLTLTEPWTGTSIVNGAYRARQLGDGTRVSTQAATVIQTLGNGVLTNLAELGVEEGKVPVGGPTGEYELVDPDTFGVQDPNGSLGKLAKLPDVGTLGLTLLPLVKGTSTQYVQGDGTLQAKAGLPISTDTQSALNGKLNTSGGQMSGSISFRMDVPAIQLRAPGGGVGYDVYANVSNSVNGGLNVRNVADSSVFLTIGGSTIGAYQVRVTGAMQVTGVLAKGSGTFLIDHPLDPFNRNLRHGFVEAPRYELIYRGTVQLENGRATVDIDVASNMSSGTFAALTTNAVVTSLQNQDGFARLKPGPINSGSFEIICEDDTCTDLVSWVVIAERNDPFVKSDLDPNTDSDGRFVPEFEKEDA